MREIFIERNNNLLRLAVKLDEKFINCRFYEEDNKPKVGEIYLGVVKNIIPSMKSIFIDLGTDRNAYLYLDKYNSKIKTGDEILVEVLKEEIGEKGATVTTKVSLGGDFAVVGDFGVGIKISKKIDDVDFVESIKKSIDAPKDMAITIRSRATEKSLDFIEIEINSLISRFKDIKQRGTYSKGPKLLYKQQRALREELLELKSGDKVYCNSKEDYENVASLLKEMNKEEVSNSLYEGEINLFLQYGLEKEILALRKREVMLKSQGYLVFNKTEAMNVIDVNSGALIEGKNMEDNIFKVNLEAANEICRQIALRDLSGIIIIDFIDMFKENHKKKIIEVLRENLRNHRNKIKVYNFTELSLVQITRERREKSILEYIEEVHRQEAYTLSRISKEYLMFLIKNELIRLRKTLDLKKVKIEINELYYFDFINNLEEFKNYLCKNEIEVEVIFNKVEIFNIISSVFN